MSEETPATELDVDPSFHPLPAFAESVQAYERTSHQDRKVEARLREAAPHPVGMTSVPHRGGTPEASAVLALLRNPHSARSAILASVILGPPKALEN
jgi:hypothetical protein